MKKLSKLVSLMLSAVLCIGMASPAFAITYYMEDGDVHVENDEEKGVYSYQGKKYENPTITYMKDDETNEIVITQRDNETATQNTITVGENVTDTTITLKDVNIDVSEKFLDAALSIEGEWNKESDVTINLEGENTLKSGSARAGLEVNDSASVTIDGAGSLTAESCLTDDAISKGYKGTGAGIGSALNAESGNITITGSGTVTAVGNNGGAGIGGGYNGSVGNITITGSGTVIAEGNGGGAGIGAGAGNSDTGDITINSSGTVTATATAADDDYLKEDVGAGIGSGSHMTGNNYGKNEVGNITITGTGSVTAKGQAGIGGGYSGRTGNITITGGTVTAEGNSGAGIGNGRDGKIGDITITGGTVTAVSSGKGAGIGAGDGVYRSTTGNITISSSGTVTATGGEGAADIGTGGGKRYTIGDITVPCTVKNGSGEAAEIKPGKSGTIYITHPDSNVVIDHGVEPTTCTSGWTEGSHCSLCNAVIVAREEIPAKHNPGEAVLENEVPASCTQDGSYDSVIRCSDCGKELSRTQKTIPASHTEVIDDAVAPTCTETGLTEGKHCSVCKTVLVEQEEVPAKGHTEVIDEAKAPTCTETGLTEGKHCSVCDAVIVAQEEIPANGHTVVIDEAVPATTISTGLTEGSHCGVCGEIIMAQEEIPMQTPTTPVFPVVPDDGTGADVTPDEDTTTLEDQEVPLAGLVNRGLLLAQLYIHEGSPDGEDAEGEYAKALAWAVEKEIVDEDADPEEIVTVAILRGIMTRYAKLLEVTFDVEIPGEDDEIVMNCDEILEKFFAELEKEDA